MLDIKKELPGFFVKFPLGSVLYRMSTGTSDWEKGGSEMKTGLPKANEGRNFWVFSFLFKVFLQHFFMRKKQKGCLTPKFGRFLVARPGHKSLSTKLKNLIYCGFFA